MNKVANMPDAQIHFKSYWETPHEEWNRMFGENCADMFLCCTGAIRLARAGSDRMVPGAAGKPMTRGVALIAP